jgi:hypothetical protein
MLARLEQASISVYGTMQRANAASTLTVAVSQLAQASAQLGGVADTLGDFRSAITDFSIANQESLEGTRQMLRTLLEQQHHRVAEESREEVQRLERQITDTVVAVQQATVHYATLVGTLRSGNDAIAGMGARMEAALREMELARGRFGEFADSATRTITERLALLDRSSRRQARYARRATEQYAGIQDGLTTLTREAGALAGAIQDGEARRMTREQEAEQRTIEATTRTITPLLVALAGQFESLPGHVREAVREGMRDADGDRRASGAARISETDRLLAAVERLTETIGGMQAELSEPMWKRLVRLRRANGR